MSLERHNVNIDILITSRVGNRNITQPIRITSERLMCMQKGTNSASSDFLEEMLPKSQIKTATNITKMQVDAKRN